MARDSLNAALSLRRRAERGQIENDLRTQWSQLVRWARTNFGEALAAWIHLKALRVFVESVLRYGLPVNFCVGLVQARGGLGGGAAGACAGGRRPTDRRHLQPVRKLEKKLDQTLEDMYAHLDSNAGRKDKKSQAIDVSMPSMCARRPAARLGRGGCSRARSAGVSIMMGAMGDYTPYVRFSIDLAFTAGR